MKQKRAFKYRVYPTPEQQHILAYTLGCCRVVYNWALRQKTDAYYNNQQRLSYKDLSERLTELKKQEDYLWLSEVSSVPLQQALRHLDKAFINFFEGRAEYPTFHKKQNKQSATYTSNAFIYRDGIITLVKIDKWYPSSKRCFDCGHLLDSLPLDIRHWTCPECGIQHDRDINAAKNIVAAGLAVLACGESVRPGAVKTKLGRTQRSRKPSK